MFATHSTVTNLVTGHLLPTVTAADSDSTAARGEKARMAAWSTKRLVENFLLRLVGKPPILTQEQHLYAALKRLEELSPHLLDDIGIGPQSGTLTDEDAKVVSPTAALYATPEIVNLENLRVAALARKIATRRRA